jgi:hypothetical protein
MIIGFGFLDWSTSRSDYYVKKRGIMQLRRVLALGIALAFAVIGTPALAQAPARGNQQQQQPKRSKAEQADIDALTHAVDLAAAGMVANDVSIKWDMQHFMRAPEGTTLFPFTVSVDRSALPGEAALYIRVMDKDQVAQAAAMAAAGDKDKKDAAKNTPPPTYAWQNIFFITVPADGKISRVIALPAGNWDAFVAIKEKAKDEKSKTPPKVGVVHQALTVPDLSAGLTTSDIILAKNIEQLQQPLSAKDQAENPYVFGPLKVTPTLDPKFPKAGELNFMFWIYGAGLGTTGKPDVQVEYNFMQGDKVITRTAPQILNATTLPPEWDPAKGHQLAEIQSIPLTTFAPGDYRLEIKVTDKTNNKVITKNVNFTVA